MKFRRSRVFIPLLLVIAMNVQAAVRYVDLNCTNPTPPFLDWSTAATTIQDAIDASVDGDQILVASGVYQTGGKVVAGDLTNRVVLDKAVTVQSVNGPWSTALLGAGATNGTAAVRCAWLTNGASLVGFTLQAGATRKSGDYTNLQSGGAVWCASTNAIVANCLIVSNTAQYKVGGVFQGSIENSLVMGNIGPSLSSGAYGANLLNCTVLSNSLGGANSCRLTNCIAYYNSSGDATGGQMAYCCTPAVIPGTGSFNTPPLLFADGVHLGAGSPCIGTGTNFVLGTDIFGMPWANPPSIGCAEWQPGPLVTQPQLQITGSPVGFTVGNLAVGGAPPFSYWWIKDDAPLQDNGHFSATQTTNLVATGVSYSDAGSYQLVVSNAFGMSTSAVARLVVHCVDAGGANPVPPYSTWATAATTIQDAIGAALANEAVLVTNGLYASGGKSMDGLITNRVSLDKALLVESLNGPSVTTIQGALDPVSTNGPAAVRCAWLTNKAVLSGFTLTGGATRLTGNASALNGGGILGASISSVADHCLVVSNYTGAHGAGAYQAALNYCTVLGNRNFSSGLGGGAVSCNLKNCVVAVNTVDQGGGGGTWNCNLTNCSVTGNSGLMYGGGVYGGTLVNCTVTGNISGEYSTQYGAAVYNATLTNCVIWGNMQRSTYANTNYANSALAYCCSDPLPSGPGNIDVYPQLLGDGVHLAQTSPCRGAGLNSVVMGTDIDGQAWNNPPAMGCDEWQPVPVFALQPSYQVAVSPNRLTFGVTVAGQAPFSYYWSKDGVALQDDGHDSGWSTATPRVNPLGLADAGGYQVVVSNAFGVITSLVAQVVIHAVDGASAAPVPPYSSWATAASTIQDAIDGSAPGDIVLVTNGLYASGGKVMAGDLTNRVVLDKPVTVMSVNGPWATLIQGAWDPVSTNGPGAVRCAWLTNGAVLSGFTLQNGATRATGGYTGSPQLTGGGAWSSGVVANCVLTNNSAVYGGGIGYGVLENSLVIGNFTSGYGGGAYSTSLQNCTVVFNNAIPRLSGLGVGTYDCVVWNSIVVNNYDAPGPFNQDNYAYDVNYIMPIRYAYSCTYPAAVGSGNTANIGSDHAFLDGVHISCNSPCRGAGTPLYSSGTDLDGESWANPPSMGCDEPVFTDRVGPLAVYVQIWQTNALVNKMISFTGYITGQAAWVQWDYGDGVTASNLGRFASHQWTNPGDYTLTFTAFNADNPAGSSTNLLVHVTSPRPVQLQSVAVVSNKFGFQFTGEFSANYTVQYATNLVPPVSWQTLQSIFYSGTQVYSITDPVVTNGTRFYRVLAQ